MKYDLRSIVRILLIILIIANLAFIFTRSMKPPAESQAESDAVGDVIEEIIPPETPVGGYVQTNIRKLAHFTEFFFLGIFTALYVILYTRGYRMAAYSLIFGAISSLLDETIQIFSGRGASVSDVWIDIAGFFASALIIYTAWYLSHYIINKSKQKLTNNG